MFAVLIACGLLTVVFGLFIWSLCRAGGGPTAQEDDEQMEFLRRWRDSRLS